MKKIFSDKITSVLEDIKSNSKTDGSVTEFRDVHKIWELGLIIKEIIGKSITPQEELRKIVRDYDWKILGKDKLGRNLSMSNYAYEWVLSFEEKDYFIKICRYAGYREGSKNRFRKRDLRYLVTIYSKTNKSKLSPAKMIKLEKQISTDSVLELNADKFQKIIADVNGSENIQWSSIHESLTNLQDIVEPITVSLENADKREELRNELGEILISQLSAAMQLCVISKESDFNYGYALAKKQEFNKKSKSKNKEFLDLFDKLKNLLKDFNKKCKLIPKSDYYDFEQTASKLDALKTETDFREFFERKKGLSKVFK